MTTMKSGNKTRSLCTKQTERKLDSFAHVLLWRSIVNHGILCLRVAFLSGSVSKYGIDVIVVVAFISYWIVIFSRLRHVGQYNSVFDQLSMRT